LEKEHAGPLRGSRKKLGARRVVSWVEEKVWTGDGNRTRSTPDGFGRVRGKNRINGKQKRIKSVGEEEELKKASLRANAENP